MLSFMLIYFIVIISKIQASEDMQKTDLNNDLHLVCVPVANIHVHPDTTSINASQILYGHPVKIINDLVISEYNEWEIDNTQKWVQVKIFDETVGFIETKNLVAGTMGWQTSNNVQRICSLYAYVYPYPSVKNQPIIKLPYNAYVQDGSFTQRCTPDDDECPWIKIFLVDNTPGWVKKGNIEQLKSVPLRDMINRITQFEGLPYLYGGSSPDGYDAAGLVQLIALQMGYKIPRNLIDQANDPNLMPVDSKNVQPGDFIFFRKNNNQQTFIHVAFYIAFNKIIHAATIDKKDRVTITNLDHSPFKDIITCVRRLPIINNINTLLWREM